MNTHSEINRQSLNSKWRLDWNCIGCGSEGMVLLSGNHIESRSDGEFDAVSIVCPLCRSPYEMFYSGIVCIDDDCDEPGLYLSLRERIQIQTLAAEREKLTLERLPS